MAVRQPGPTGTGPRPSTTPHPSRTPRIPRIPRTPRPSHRLLPLALALLLAGAVLAAAHHARPLPYGDRLTVLTRADARTAKGAAAIRGTGVEAYDPATGAVRWRHAREGRRPLEVLPARGEAITLWDDGMITAADGRTVRWHRALPAATGWLPAYGGTGVLRPLPRGMLAVITPDRIAAYRIKDGDLRWALPAGEGCAFEPGRAVRHEAALLVAQPCPAGAWTAQLIAVDDLGRIAPDRTPLGNDVPGRTSEPAKSEKLVAEPR
ncbi:PQQ-binding-like beta-propeller repeat protein [Streptomyces sp. NPDC088789]|uniref:outer membrane protein assembly factor BamB family protein n=1 Tax=Streptomyces sp. NPDC088789 TaxID=3365899 RepID=UPI00381429F3